MASPPRLATRRTRRRNCAGRDAALSGPEISEAEHEVTLRAERPVVDTESVPIDAGRELAPPTPIFTKLDPSVIDDELGRLES